MGFDTRDSGASKTVSSRDLTELEQAAATASEAVESLTGTIDYWLASPYFEVEETQATDSNGESENPSGEVTVTYDPDAVPKQKKTRSALKEVEQGQTELTEQAEAATEAVEELEEELGDVALEMDIPQILAGDYSSIAGVWRDAKGSSLDIEGSTILWDDGYDYDGPSPTVKGLMLDFGFETTEGHGDYNGGSPQITWGWQADPDQPGGFFGSCLVFFPVGAPAVDVMNGDENTFHKVIPSDESVERILALSTNCIGRLSGPDNSAYLMYRTDETPSGTTTGNASNEKDTDGSKETASENSKCKAPVPGAYPCAGQGLPEGAQEIHTVLEPYATAVTPSKNIGCDLFRASDGREAYLKCPVSSWDPAMDPDYNDFTGGVLGIWLGSDSGPAKFSQTSDAPNFGGWNGPPAGKIMEYGNVYYWDDFVLASEENGLTVWSAVSGHGAFFNRDGFWPF